MRFGLTDNVIEKIQKVFESNARVDKAYVFGSRAKGNYKDGSDIDIAIKGQELTFDDVLSLNVKLDDCNLIYQIDLLDYAAIKEPVLKEHIDRVGIEFYSRWREYKLGDITDIQTGPFGSLLHASDYVSAGIPTIMPTNIGVRLEIQRDNLSFIKEEDASRLQRYLVQENDIVYSRRGDVEKCAFVTKNESGWLCGTGCLRIRFSSNIALPKYCAYFLSTDEIKGWVTNNAVGSTMPNLNSTVLANLPLRLPPIPEQTAIASILSSLDDKIDLLQRQNRTLEQLAETLFRQWFVEEAEESWEVKSLVEIAEYLNGLALQKFPAKGNDFLPVIKIREMKQGISENTEICSSNIPTKYVIQDGDVLFSWSGSLEVVLWSGGEGALNQHLFKVTSNDYPKWFYYFATKHHLLDFKIIAESKSTTMGHIQREHLKQAMISIPPKQIFEEYDLRISHLVDKLIDNNKQIRTLTQTRDTLLPKLMSGEVRVNL